MMVFPLIHMMIQPIENTPALFIPDYETLVIADLHIGIEYELREYGVHIESNIAQLESDFLGLCNKYNPKEIILLGDIKHSISSTPFYEKKQLYNLLKKIQEIAQVHIIPGNHDGGIKQIIPQGIKVHKSDGFKMGNCAFVHGHRWPAERIMLCSYLFCGHTHPTVKLTDHLGYHYYEPCWVKTPVYEKTMTERYQIFNKKMMMIIIPVFNPLCGGIAVNDEGILSPMKYLVNPREAEIYLLDGTSIGTLDKF
jgi:putative SbcD/Mre11-related phosphoesterase